MPLGESKECAALLGSGGWGGRGVPLGESKECAALRRCPRRGLAVITIRLPMQLMAMVLARLRWGASAIRVVAPHTIKVNRKITSVISVLRFWKARRARLGQVNGFVARSQMTFCSAALDLDLVRVWSTRARGMVGGGAVPLALIVRPEAVMLRPRPFGRAAAEVAVAVAGGKPFL